MSTTERLRGLSPQKQEYLRRLAAARADGPVARRPGGPAALSFGQERMWFLHSLEPTSPSYTLFYAIRLGAIDVDTLERALDVVVERHEVLRTRYVLRNEAPAAVVDTGVHVGIERIDLRGTPGALATAGELAARAAHTAFDLETGPVLRASVLTLDGPRCVLLFTCHHIALDAWSMGRLLDELTGAYTALRAGRTPQLTPLPVQYGDFAAWQRARLSGERCDRLLGFWRATLSGVPALELPADRPRPEVRNDVGGAAVALRPSPTAIDALRVLATSEHASLYQVLLAGYAVLLHRLSGQEDFVVGTPVEGRVRSELEPLIGFFINTVLVRIRVDSAATFRDLLRRVRRAALDAFDHQELPVERLIQDLAPERRLDRTPLFQTTFQVQTAGDLPLTSRPDGITVAPRRSLFDLSVDLMESATGLTGHIEFSADLFDRPTIEYFARYLGTLFESAAADPDRAVGRLSMLTLSDRAELAGRHEAPVPASWAAVPELLPASDGVAVRCADRVLSYNELHAAARVLAARLAARMPSGATVGLVLKRGPDLVVAQLACWLAGLAFVPLDPAHPRLRNDAALAAAGAECVLIGLDGDGDGDAGLTAPLRPPGELAYLMATSGTTGTPKLVEVPHRALANHATAIVAALGLRSTDRVLAAASPAFDVSLEEIWPSLVAGAEVVAASCDPFDLTSLRAEIDAAGVTVLNLPTPLWHEWLLTLEAGHLPIPPAVRLIVIGSDRVEPADMVRWAQLPKPRPQLMQAYGVTEATITSLVHELPTEPGPGDAAVIGRPIANVTAYVLDEAGDEQPVGVPGELHLGGAGLASGYRGDAGTDAESAFGLRAAAPDRLYRTGDQAVLRHDGTLAFLGRRDEQVKVRGVRIEPAEVAAHLRSHPDVHDAVVTARDGALVAHVVPAGLPVGELRAHLAARVPAASVPVAINAVDRLPLTSNGKVDACALPVVPPPPSAGTAPRTPTERAVASVWCDLLGAASVGIDDNFFDLGAHSLLLVRVQLRLRAALAVEFGVLELFRFPTVRALARYLDRLRS